jgi:hypothetical protein
MVDTMATRINILHATFFRIYLKDGRDTYRVVALRVNVKLIEKMAKSHDGKVRVVKVISQ